MKPIYICVVRGFLSTSCQHHNIAHRHRAYQIGRRIISAMLFYKMFQRISLCVHAGVNTAVVFSAQGLLCFFEGSNTSACITNYSSIYLIGMPSPGAIGFSAMTFSISVESVGDNSSGCDQPNICVRLPCASASISRTFLPCRERPMPRLAAVVVLPTPPF